MGRKLWMLVVIAVGTASIGAAFIGTSGGDAAAAVKTRQIYMSAVEWKGSSNVSKEAYPTKPLPGGGGYESFPPGHEEVASEPGKWAVETYRFDTAVVAACQGERVVLNIFGVNSKLHEIVVPAFNKNFTVFRGQLSKVNLGVAKKTGIFSILCITHKPSHRADLVVLPC